MDEEKTAAVTPNAEETEAKDIADTLYASGDKAEDKPEGEKPEGGSEDKPAEKSDEAEGESKDDDGEGEKSAKDEDSDKPEKYEFETEEDSPITDEMLDEIALYSKAQGLSQKQAQEVVDIQEKALNSYQEKLMSNFHKQSSEWKAEAARDPEIGGVDHGEKVELAKRVIDKYATPEFSKEIVKSGFGNHPELVRIFHRIGKAMGNDSLVLGGDKPSTGKKTPEQIFYGGTST